MSSFSKNLIPRRIHKERSQPLGRISKHGLLEKKKDYRLRARDANKKAARLKLLKEKASFRNPDEFYHAMINTRTKDGVIQSTPDHSHPNSTPLEHRTRDERLLAETNDAAYVQYKRAVERKRIDKMKNNLHFIDSTQSTKHQRTHIIFADDEDEANQILDQRRQKEIEQSKRTAQRNYNTNTNNNSNNTRFLKKLQRKEYHQLAQHVERHEKLDTVLQDIHAEKKLLAKGRRFLVKPANKTTGAPPVFRWLQERSR